MIGQNERITGDIRLMKKRGKKRESRSGRKPRKPLCVIYKNGNKVVAALMSPSKNEIKSEMSTGPYAAMGLLRDKDYDFGELIDEAPEWVLEKIPKNCELIGVATITSFPLV